VKYYQKPEEQGRWYASRGNRQEEAKEAGVVRRDGEGSRE